MTSFAVLIPARYASTRFPGKPLVKLRGASGVAKSLIQRSWECASEIKGCSGVWVATDDNRIADEVRSFGGQVVMTSPDCANGTERCAEAIEKINCPADFVVNLQGDAPLTPAHFVPALVKRLCSDSDAAMATSAVRCSPSVLAHLETDAAKGRVGGTTAAFASSGRALYFSKRILPYVSPADNDRYRHVHLHLGLYAYRRSGLQAYLAAGPSPLERLEGLEQLRFLENGLPVSVVDFDAPDWDPLELNNPTDVPSIESELLRRGLA